MDITELFSRIEVLVANSADVWYEMETSTIMIIGPDATVAIEMAEHGDFHLLAQNDAGEDILEMTVGGHAVMVLPTLTAAVKSVI